MAGSVSSREHVPQAPLLPGRQACRRALMRPYSGLGSSKTWAFEGGRLRTKSTMSKPVTNARFARIECAQNMLLQRRNASPSEVR